MVYYIAVPQSKTHAFLLERKLANAGIPCDLSYLPRPISTGPCNMGVKFREAHYKKALDIIQASGLPGCKVFMETINANSSAYYEMKY